MKDPNREAIEAAFKAKLAEILDRRKMVRETRANLALKERELDRELADLRAGARSFEIQLDIPPDEEAARRYVFVTRPDGVVVRQRITPDGTVDEWALARKPPQLAGGGEPVPISPPQAAPISKRPPIREIVIDQLKEAGAKGARAADIRQYIERVYDPDIHEKTVGMTLYRLSQRDIVRRRGLRWFFVPPLAEAKNPGVGAPGLNNLANREGDEDD